MAARKPRQATTAADEEGGKKKKAPPARKSKKPAPAKQPALAKQTKPVKQKTSKPSPLKKIHKGKVMKVHKGKRSDHLVDEEDEEPQLASKPQVEDDGVPKTTTEEGKGIATDEEEAQSLLDLQKPKKQKPVKANVETKVESMVTVPIHQASSSVPPLSTPIINLTPPKHVSPPAQETIFTTTTATTTTLPLPPTSTTTKVYTLENHDLYSNIDKYVNGVVKEADSQTTSQAPIRERFRELSEFEMKEILHDRMLEISSYRSHLEHTTLYEALEASMDHENKEEFIEEMAKSRKRRHDDQDPPPPPPKDTNQSKKKRYDSDASASKQPPV
ncbi:hypothetical protein Tco_1237214 [Tanacetum coccineum]